MAYILLGNTGDRRHARTEWYGDAADPAPSLMVT
jgi:hypothetical protein